MFSSKNKGYETPQDVFDDLNREFRFTLDVCAVKETAKCRKFYSPDNDAFNHKWRGVCWMNPPYGEPEHACKPKCVKKACQKRGYHINTYIPGIADWMKKAYEESINSGAVVVCLVPARTDTKMWHEYCMKAYEIRFVKGRLKFGDSENTAPFPSAIVVFDASKAGRFPIISSYTPPKRKPKKDLKAVLEAIKKRG